MRSSSRLAAPFDRVSYRQGGFWPFLTSRIARYALLALFALCLSTVLPPGKESSFSDLQPTHLNFSNDALLAVTGWNERAEMVKAAFVRVYGAYERGAFPHDELLPVTNSVRDNMNGWGLSLVDGLDTMILMGLDDVSNRSIGHIRQLQFDQDQFVPFFETVIRYLGGLLSAYALTGKAIFLQRADELGTLLLPAFQYPDRATSFSVNPKTRRTQDGWAGHVSILSEMGSCQLEYRYLAHLTGKVEYVRAVDRITDFLQERVERSGLYPLTFNLGTGLPTSTMFSVGAWADSAYEYLLKQWLQSGRTESRYLDMYLQSADAVISHLMYLSPVRSLLYVTDITRVSLFPTGDFQHLSCFLSGLFALGVLTIPPSLRDERHAWVAEGLAQTCWITYADSATGLGPERVRFMNAYPGQRWVAALDKWEKEGRREETPPGVREVRPERRQGRQEYSVLDGRYMLRPEAIESFYLMWRMTGDIVWRERGWAVFKALETHARLGDAYASIHNVHKVPATHENDMPSFLFAETFKYAYLLFTDDDPLPLDRWVFNTEAHPLPVFHWSHQQQSDFGIAQFKNATRAQ